MKPMIAIVSLYDEKLESYWMLPGYAQGLEAAGAAPVILPLTTDPAVLQRYAQTFDGFLFPGGHDLPPSLYGEEPSEKLGPLVPQRDSMEQAFFPLALETGKPMLGICRGIQLFNVMLGGDCTRISPPSAPAACSTTRPRPTTRWPIRWPSAGARPCSRPWAWRRWGSIPTITRASGDWGRAWKWLPPRRTAWWRRCTCRSTGLPWRCSAPGVSRLSMRTAAKSLRPL